MEEPKVSHADLDAVLEGSTAPEEAAEETVEKTEEPEQAISKDPEPEDPEPEKIDEPEEPEEPEDHKERSKLGRRVSGLEQNIGALIEKIDQLVTAKASPEPEDPDDDEPVFMTKKQLREFVRDQARNEVVQTEAEKQKAQTKYENAYVGHVRKLGENLTPKQLEAVFKEMFDNHNNVIHRIPEIDADINFHRAVAALAKKSPAQKVVPLKKEAPKNLGGATDTDSSEKPVRKKVKLDEHAAAFAKYHKLTDEQIDSALSSETPLSLKGKI